MTFTKVFLRFWVDDDALVRVELRTVHPNVRDLLERCKALPQQRTEEWYRQRNQRVTASEVAAVIGRSKFQSKNVALRMKVGAILGDEVLCPPRTGNYITDWGNRNEDHVRDRFCREYDEVCHETGCVPHTTVPLLGASPDGVLESGCLLEIKCPFKRDPVPGQIPEMYYHQMQLQMEVCNLDATYYVEWKPSTVFGEPEREVFQVQLVVRDCKWLETWLPTIEKFWDRVQSYVADPERARAELRPRTRRRKRAESPDAVVDDEPIEQKQQEPVASLAFI